MAILVGMDEAGYGPNYGPLVVAATAWDASDRDASEVNAAGRGATARTSNGRGARGRDAAHGALRRGAPTLARAAAPAGVDLYKLLRPTVARAPHDKRIAIADSKILYRPGLGLRQLERGLHAALSAIERPAGCWDTIVALCGADPAGHHRGLCWHAGFNCSLPIDTPVAETARLAGRLRRACDGAGVRLLAIRARMVFPAEFNELVDHYGTKGAALSHVTVRLLREVIDEARGETARGGSSAAAGDGPARPVEAVCDKHGGRNFYTALLQHYFSEDWIEPVWEGAEESRYEWGPSEARVSVSFRMGGESFLPTALASMAAKYLRELAMRAWNEFWCARVPGLRPTAGYPKDSRRFRRDIAAVQRALAIDDRLVWRSR